MNLKEPEILLLKKDYQKNARAVKLVHVHDDIAGITRVGHGKGYSYHYKGEKITDEDKLKRIKSLVIPPAWKNVWICPKANGHLQATGYDTKNRKQYKYHPLWSEFRNETKFHRLYEFGKHLPALRERLQEDLRKHQLSHDKVMAIVISLMERTYIRIGNEDYQRQYGSYGITTLTNRHVQVSSTNVRFSFVGKKGKRQEVALHNRRLARAIKQCKDIPGKELFQYYDNEGKHHPIDSGMVNDYIREAAGADFTAKDFRTWAGTLNMLNALRIHHHPDKKTKKILVQALDEVSKKLGNTRTICKKYYVHPGLIRLYEEDNLHEHLAELDDLEGQKNEEGLTCDEMVLMKILKQLLPANLRSKSGTAFAAV